jgi:hypothetical protein
VSNETKSYRVTYGGNGWTNSSAEHHEIVNAYVQEDGTAILESSDGSVYRYPDCTRMKVLTLTALAEELERTREQVRELRASSRPSPTIIKVPTCHKRICRKCARGDS